MRLNKQDGGRRRCVIVTNNEVSAEEADDLRKRGLRPGDEAWEALGIANYITKPRIASAVTGRTPSGAPVKGDYKFGGEFAISEGLAQNVEFFDLTYEDVNEVRYALAFEAIAPLLWLKAGSEGRKIMDATKDFDLAEAYGVLFNIDASGPFLAAVAKAEGLRCVFIVTDSDSQYQLVANELPDQVESVRLYEAYLRSVEIAPGMVQ